MVFFLVKETDKMNDDELYKKIVISKIVMLACLVLGIYVIYTK